MGIKKLGSLLLLATLAFAQTASAVLLDSDTVLSSERGLDRAHLRSWVNGSGGGKGWGNKWVIGDAAFGGTSIERGTLIGSAFDLTAQSDWRGFQGSTQAFRQFSSPFTAGEKFFWQMSATTYGDAFTLSQSQRLHNLGGGYVTQFLIGPSLFTKDYYVYDWQHPTLRTGIPSGTPINCELDLGENGAYKLMVSPIFPFGDPGIRPVLIEGNIDPHTSNDGLLAIKIDDQLTHSLLFNNLIVAKSASGSFVSVVPEPKFAAPFLIGIGSFLMSRRRQI